MFLILYFNKNKLYYKMEFYYIDKYKQLKFFNIHKYQQPYSKIYENAFRCSFEIDNNL